MNLKRRHEERLNVDSKIVKIGKILYKHPQVKSKAPNQGQGLLGVGSGGLFFSHWLVFKDLNILKFYDVFIFWAFFDIHILISYSKFLILL